MLVEKTAKNSRNLSSMEAIFDVIQRFSVREKNCFDNITGRKIEIDGVYYVSLGKDDSRELFELYGQELMVNVSKTAADTLAEESGKLGLVSYYDDSTLSDFVQFRLRRSGKYQGLDLRSALVALNIPNGGGHPGAIGFRVNKSDVLDIHEYTKKLAVEVQKLAT
jgi:hypothetical protein